MTAAEALRLVQDAVERGDAAVEVVVTASSAEAVLPGRRMVVDSEGPSGELGHRELELQLEILARDMMAGPSTVCRMVEMDGWTCTVYLQLHRPPDELVILGAGHIARPLCAIGAMIGYRVVVLDDRPEFATADRFAEAHRVLRVDARDPFADVALRSGSRLVLVTRGHRHDFEALRLALRLPEPPEYIGMVGSKRRVRATLEQLVREGIPQALLGRIHAPIGLDIGAQTPAEIAVAIAAELVRLSRSGTGEPLRDRERVLERWISTD